MSRQYDQTFLDIPGSIPYEDMVYEWGVGYARIFGYFDYFITTDGDVISFRSREPKLIKQWPTNHGHLYVDLSEKGKRNRCLVHRLVAEAFIPNPNNYPLVRHLDDDPQNNYVGNLAWGTSLDNREDMIRNGHDFKRGVYCYELDKYYKTCREAAKDLGVSYSQITVNCQGKVSHTNGYHLCYAEDLEDKLKDPTWLTIKKGYKPLIVYDERTGEELYFESRNAASEYTGIPACTISCLIRKTFEDAKLYKGWKFKEAANND